MKTTTEILATWENEGFYTDWYAIDSYDPITREETRLFVGELDDVVTTMNNYYEQPAMVSGAKFYRSCIIPNDEAREYFERILVPNSSIEDLTGRCVEIVARKYELYFDYLKDGNDEMKDEYFTAYWHTMLMASEITGKTVAEINALVNKVAKC